MNKTEKIILNNLRKLVPLGEDLNKWLEEMSKKYNIDKDDIQVIIKQFLM